MTEIKQLKGKRLALFRQANRVASVMQEMRETETVPEHVAKFHEGIAVATEFKNLQSLPPHVFDESGDVNPEKLKSYYGA